MHMYETLARINITTQYFIILLFYVAAILIHIHESHLPAQLAGIYNLCYWHLIGLDFDTFQLSVPALL